MNLRFNKLVRECNLMSSLKLRNFALEIRAILRAKLCKSAPLPPPTRARGAKKTPTIIRRAMLMMHKFS